MSVLNCGCFCIWKMWMKKMPSLELRFTIGCQVYLKVYVEMILIMIMGMKEWSILF